MSNSIETVGIIGFGAMGQLVGERMFPESEIVAYDPNITASRVNNIPLVPLGEAASRDTVVLAVPGPEFRETVMRVAHHFPSRGEFPLLVDISSVKEAPNTFLDVAEITNQLLVCHPLFGPQSAEKTLRGHRVIVTEQLGNKASRLLDRWQRLGLHILEMTAEEHDCQMAAILAVPFIFGRIATSLALDDSVELQTPSRLAVRKLEGLDKVQSEALFQTIVGCNPHVGPLLDKMQEVIADLKDRHKNSTTLGALKTDKEILLEGQDKYGEVSP